MGTAVPRIEEAMMRWDWAGYEALMRWELAGYIASALVLAAFYMENIVALRIVALLSNLAFIVYGVALNLAPVWLLHTLLVPLNLLRLIETARRRRTRGKRADAGSNHAD